MFIQFYKLLEHPPAPWETYRTIDEDGHIIAWEHIPRTNAMMSDFEHTIPGKTQHITTIHKHSTGKLFLKITDQLRNLQDYPELLL